MDGGLGCRGRNNGPEFRQLFTDFRTPISLRQTFSFPDSLVFTARRYASAVLAVIVCLSVCLSVRPSVCLSVTSRSCTKTAKPRIRLTTPYDSPETLVF